jgi:hypothetical protein
MTVCDALRAVDPQCVTCKELFWAGVPSFQAAAAAHSQHKASPPPFEFRTEIRCPLSTCTEISETETQPLTLFSSFLGTVFQFFQFELSVNDFGKTKERATAELPCPHCPHILALTYQLPASICMILL